jgi:hypothetical protein
MKLVITESQYNRIFNKKKSKLIITESQYNRLLLEANMQNSINQVKEGDAIKLIDKKGSELYFKVIDSISGQLLMINCNDGVYKNSFFHVTSADIQGGNVTYRGKHKKYLNIEALSKESGGKFNTFKDVEDAKKAGEIDEAEFKKLSTLVNNEVLKMGPKLIMNDLKNNGDTWKNGTWKNVQLGVFDDEATGLSCNLSPSSKPKFTIDTGSGDIGKDFKEGDIGGEDEIQSLIDEILSSKVDELYTFKLSGGDIDLLTLNKDGNNIAFKIDKVSGPKSDRYTKSIGDTIEFNGDPKNVKIKNSGENEEFLFSLKFKKYVGGSDNKGETKSEDFILDNILDFESKSGGSTNGERSRNEKTELALEIGNYNEDDIVSFNFKDGKTIKTKVLNKDNNSISFDVLEADKYSYLKDNLIEFEIDESNVNIKQSGEGEDFIFDLRIKRYLGGSNEEGNGKSEQMILEDLVDVLKDLTFEPVDELSDKEINKIIDDLTKGNQTIIDAMWKKPNWFVDLLKLGDERGIIPAEDRLNKRLYSVIDEFKEFEKNSIKTMQFVNLNLKEQIMDKALSDINSKETKSSSYIKPIKPSKFEKFKTKSNRINGDKNVPMVETNFKPTLNKEEKLYFRIYLNKKLDETDKLLKYEVKIYYNTGNNKTNPEVGEGVVEIKKEENKQEKK